MMDKKTQRDAELVALTHRKQLLAMTDQLAQLSEHREGLSQGAQQQKDELSNLDAQIQQLWAESGISRLPEELVQQAAIQKSLQLSDHEIQEGESKLPSFDLDLPLPHVDGDWDALVAQANNYLQTHSIDLSVDPMQQLLSPAKVAEIARKFKLKYDPAPWDQWDYSVVGLSALMGGLLDFFLVSTFPGGVFHAGPLTTWMKDQSRIITGGKGNKFQKWLGGLAKSSEEWAKVSYDISNNRYIKDGSKLDGLRPKLHRQMNPGHDPILGFLFGTFDLLRGDCTLIDRNGCWNVIRPEDRLDSATSESNPAIALLKVAVHLFSDVFTEQGLPAPFMSIFGSLDVNTGVCLRDGGVPVQFPDLVRHMYSQGYDFRHFLSMSVVPAVAELMIRSFHAIRTWGLPAEEAQSLAQRQKLAAMLMATHSVLTSANIMKLALSGWNPLAINLPQFLMFAKQGLTLLKLSSERKSQIEKDLASGWVSILQTESSITTNHSDDHVV